MVVKVKNVDGAIIAALNLPSSNQKRLRKLSRFFCLCPTGESVFSGFLAWMMKSKSCP
jgi:hypothetical protein